MNKIGVIGGRDSVLGFRALGLDTCIAENGEQAKAALARGAGLSAVLSLPVRGKIAKLKYAASAAAFEDAERETKRQLSALGKGV